MDELNERASRHTHVPEPATVGQRIAELEAQQRNHTDALARVGERLSAIENTVIEIARQIEIPR